MRHIAVVTKPALAVDTGWGPRFFPFNVGPSLTKGNELENPRLNQIEFGGFVGKIEALILGILPAG